MTNEPYKLFVTIEGDFMDAQKIGRMPGHTSDYSTIPGGFRMERNYANPMNHTKRLVTLHVQKAKHVVRVAAFAQNPDDAEMAMNDYVSVMGGRIIRKG
ncbi:MAG TPA: hypothetical protein VJB05_01130 [archaeon]|nr:hypothetical protein [archaeon]